MCAVIWARSWLSIVMLSFRSPCNYAIIRAIAYFKVWHTPWRGFEKNLSFGGPICLVFFRRKEIDWFFLFLSRRDPHSGSLEYAMIWALCSKGPFVGIWEGLLHFARKKLSHQPSIRGGSHTFKYSILRTHCGKCMPMSPEVDRPCSDGSYIQSVFSRVLMNRSIQGMEHRNQN